MKKIISLCGTCLLVVGCTSPEEQELHDVHQQVIKDAIVQYENVKKTQDKLEICMYAGMVTAAYVQANMQKDADQWKKIEDDDCKKAGIPMQ